MQKQITLLQEFTTEPLTSKFSQIVPQNKNVAFYEGMHFAINQILEAMANNSENTLENLASEITALSIVAIKRKQDSRFPTLGMGNQANSQKPRDRHSASRHE